MQDRGPPGPELATPAVGKIKLGVLLVLKWFWAMFGREHCEHWVLWVAVAQEIEQSSWNQKVTGSIHRSSELNVKVSLSKTLNL